MKKLKFEEVVSSLKQAITKSGMIPQVLLALPKALSGDALIEYKRNVKTDKFSIKYKCPVCEKEHHIESDDYWNHYMFNCPECGQSLYLANGHRIFENDIIFGFKEKEDVEVYVYLKEPTTPEDLSELRQAKQILVYDMEDNRVYGWYPYSDKDTPELGFSPKSTSTTSFTDLKWRASKPIIYLYGTTPFLTIEVFDLNRIANKEQLSAYSINNRFENTGTAIKRRRKTSTCASSSLSLPPRLLANAEKTYNIMQAGMTDIGQAESIEVFNEIQKAAASINYFTTVSYDQLHNTETIQFTCPSCGCLHQKDVARNISECCGDSVCSCGKDLSKITFYSTSSQKRNELSTGLIYINDYDNDVIINTYWAGPWKEDYSKCSFVFNQKGFTEIMEAPQKIIDYARANSLPYTHYCAPYGATQEHRSLGSRDIVAHWNVVNNSTLLKFFPFKELVPQLDNMECLYHLFDCITMYFKAPNIIESLLKRIPNIMDSLSYAFDHSKLAFAENNPCLSNDWSSVESLMRLSKANMKVLQQRSEKFYKESAHLLAVFATEHDEVITSDIISYLLDHHIIHTSLRTLYKALPNCSLPEVVQYLEHCRQYQCIDPLAAIQLWIDYAESANKIGVDFTDKKARHPRSLKMEHDVFTYKYSLLKNEQRNAEFAATTKQDMKYCYKNKDLFIRPPATMEELFEEGRKLDHCVGTYGDRIIEGRSHIFFVRWNKDPNEPYFTVEMINGQITQIHGFADCNPSYSTPELNKFLKEWAAIHKFSFNCYC